MAARFPTWLLLFAHIACAPPDSIESDTAESNDDVAVAHVEEDRSPPAPAAAATAAPALVEPTCPQHLRCDFEALRRDPKLVVDAIRVEKAAHRLYLLSDETAVKSYRVALGWGGAGFKRQEGDGVTPVGSYKLTGRLATSPWHLLIGVSYPNYEDVKRFAALKQAGEVPPDANIGFGIALHGRRKDALDGEHKKTDWTAGCIAVDNDEIQEIAGLVKTGTSITIVD
jgi:hypothetical protein